MNTSIKVTPINGGSVGSGGMCSLLELGTTSRVLLDCGISLSTLAQQVDIMDENARRRSTEYIEQMLKKLEEIKFGDNTDIVLLSHGDFAHVGALPLVSSRLRRPLKLICTKPVFHMAQMVLYDAYINLSQGKNTGKQEGDQDCENDYTDIFNFTLDDIDNCFSDISFVKYNEEKDIMLDPTSPSQNGGVTKISALPSGRTVGGTSWLISHGTATVVYAVGINMKKELVLDGFDLRLLPTSPSLLIVDGDCSSSSSSGMTSKIWKGKKKKDDFSQNLLVTTVMETVRKGIVRNILLPCESGGRALELMQLLARNVMNDKSRLEVDQLIYLTPMASNVVEYAKGQLEWMSASLCDGFYKGEINPFEFDATSHDVKRRKQMELLKCITSLEELDQMGNNGIKIVLATDSSLTTGFSKELLLRWGGDPASMVIFTSEPEANSIGAEVLRQISTPPVLVTIVKQQRVALQGDELYAYLKLEEEKKKEKAEAELQDKREAELSAFVNDVAEAPEDSDDDVSDGENDEYGKSMDVHSGVNRGARNHAAFMSGLGKYAKPRHAQFENVEFDTGAMPLEMDTLEYGKPIEDLNLPTVIMPTFAKKSKNFASDLVAPPIESEGETAPNQVNTSVGSSKRTEEEVSLPPSKFVKFADKVQLTCAFSYVPWDGKADIKTVKRIVSELNPHHVAVLKGKHHASIIKHCQDKGLDACSPPNYETLEFQAFGGVRKISLSSTARGDTTKRVGDSGCILKKLKAGTNSLVFTQKGGDLAKLSLLEVQGDVNEENTDVEDYSGQTSHESPLCLSLLNSNINEVNTLGRLSFGELSLKALKSKLISRSDHDHQKGMQVEYKLGVKGSILLCDQQSTIRKINENDVVVEGSPGLAFYEAKRGVYSSFALS